MRQRTRVKDQVPLLPPPLFLPAKSMQTSIRRPVQGMTAKFERSSTGRWRSATYMMTIQRRLLPSVQPLFEDVDA